MKIGRNAPCPCGSGKKYKKCCLRKNEASPLDRRQEKGFALRKPDKRPITGEAPERQSHESFDEDLSDDAKERAFYKAFWKNFGSADFTEKVKIVEDAFTNPKLIHEDIFFDLFNGLKIVASNIDERGACLDLTERLKKEQPEIYDRISGFLLHYGVAYALIDGKNREAGTMFKDLARIAHRDIDYFNESLEQIAYHGHLELLVEAMRIGWEQVKDSSDIVPWGIDEYEIRAYDYELLDYLTQNASTSSEDESLIRRLENYGDLDREYFEGYFSCITRNSGRKWRIGNFDIKSGKEGNRNKGVSLATFKKNLSCLTNEFLGYLHEDEGTPYSRAQMIRAEMRKYLLRRAEGDIEEKPSMLEVAMNPHKKWETRTPGFEHILCPDRSTFDLFLAEYFHFLSRRLHKALACFEGVPAWLRFLESIKLIDFDLRKRTYRAISKLYSQMERLVNDHTPKDVYLLHELEKAWNDPDMETKIV